MKRSNNVMLRLSDEEHKVLAAAVPPGDDKAAFVRKALMSALDGPDPQVQLRRASAFVVACLSPEITFEEALSLFDEHVPAGTEEVRHGGND